MKHLQVTKLVVLICLIFFSLTSCSKEEVGRDQDFAGITVSLKSDSGELNNVFLDIEDIQVKITEDDNASSAWMSLNTINTGSHNVSDLRGDTELLLVNHYEIKPTYIHEIRLVLGDNNFINVNDMLVHLDVTEIGNAKPSNFVKKAFEGNHIYQVVINLDIDASVDFNATENMTVLNPKLYTQIRKF
ncbi:MAG: DUF4382 domain-containing protein [Winogradskyella sp.]|uniref:DUF4382 domain-containing protein n=1 Tax=Winogradskyella sp. TaxID=1883156 RepID=UPI00385A7D8A